MQIDQSIIDQWKSLRDRGDLKKLADITGVSFQTLIKAFNEAQCTEETFIAISKFYEERRERVQKITVEK